MTAPAEVRKVGVVGTGEMGRPVIDRLVAAGFDVAAFARRPEVREELASSGVDVIGDVGALGRDRDVVLLYVFSDAQVRSVVMDDGLLDALAPGSLLVVHTTSNPDTIQEIAERARPRGVGVLDAAGSGGPATVATGGLVLLVGGEAGDVDRCRPLFAAYSSQVTHFGDVGSGQRAKLVNNLLFGAHVELALDAARISEAFGLDPLDVARTLHACSGASFALDLIPQMGSPEALVEGAGWTIHKDVHYAIDLMEQLGAPLGSFDGVITAALERTAPHRRPEA